MRLSEKVVTVLSTNADVDSAIRMKAYMKDQFEFHGVSSPDRKALCKEIFSESRKMGIDDLVIELQLLWADVHRECQYVAGDILIKNKKRLDSRHLPFVENLILKKSWWDTVDFIASHIVGILFQKFPNLHDEKLDTWLGSKNIWLNRTCLIYQLKYGSETNFEELKESILKLRHKDEFFIQKAIGWSLRQYSKFNPKAVKLFIENETLSNLARKEGGKYV